MTKSLNIRLNRRAGKVGLPGTAAEKPLDSGLRRNDETPGLRRNDETRHQPATPPTYDLRLSRSVA